MVFIELIHRLRTKYLLGAQVVHVVGSEQLSHPFTHGRQVFLFKSL